MNNTAMMQMTLLALHSCKSDSDPKPRERTLSKPYRREERVGRNKPCPCGSGKKRKRCRC